MQQTGVYEQLITKLIDSRLNREQFYVGERQLSYFIGNRKTVPDLTAGEVWIMFSTIPRASGYSCL
jgi:hypothetical protein